MDDQKLSPHSPDGVLAASALRGDLEAFRELYHRYVRHVYDFLLRSVHDPAVAHELTQATFLRAHARLPSLRDPDRVREWLFGLAYRLAVGQLRRGPVPVSAAALPRAVGPRLGGGGVGEGDDLEGTDLVWAAASALPADLYAVIDVTSRQGLDVSELAEDAGLPRDEVMAQLERAHEAYGRTLRELLTSSGGEWCPGLAAMLQTTDATTDEGRARVDEHLGHCPRCRPLTERITTPAALSSTPLHPVDPVLAREGWDLLLEEMSKAAPRATRAALNQPEPPAEDTAQLVASDSAMEYFAFPAAGASTLRRETDIMRHESVRRTYDRAENSRFRTALWWTLGAIFLIGVVVAAIIVNTDHPPKAANLDRPPSTPATSSTPGTAAPATSAHPGTTRATGSTTRTTRPPTRTTRPPTKTTAPPPPVPVLTGMTPVTGYPGAPVTLTGTHFVPGDLVDFTGPTLPGGTEELTPSSLSSTKAQSNVPAFATFAGQHIVVAVQNSSGVVSRSETFVVSAYWSGTWSNTHATVSLQPTSAKPGSTSDGVIDVFQTDVEAEQCMVDESAPVYTSIVGGQPIAVIAKTTGCPSAEFAIVGG